LKNSPGPGALGFRVIGAFKLVSGALLIAAGFGIFRLMNKDLGEATEHFVTRLHLDPENRLIASIVWKVAGIDQTHLKAIGFGTLFFALLYLVEGSGLLLRKHWAEYLTVVATGAFLPLEVYEIIRKLTVVRFGVLAINLAILIYLIINLRREHRARRASVTLKT
jgi:uncharacterized membrane protein (DUF2068 family)